MPQVDVVIVPDFRGNSARVFEVRTLLFLGSWLEHKGASRDWPVHVACIGKPPDSVTALAAKCGARITQHENLSTPRSRTLNKLRGLEIKPETDHVFLLDVDIIIQNDLAPLLDLRGSISALPEYKNRLRPELWPEVYAVCGVPMPEERIRSQRGRLARSLPAGQSRSIDQQPMPPHFNSGVLFLPVQWLAPMRQHWAACLEKIDERYLGKPDDDLDLTGADDVGLAIAISILRSQGATFKTLPDALHGNRWFYWSGALTFANTSLFHTIRFLRMGKAPLDVDAELSLWAAYLQKGLYGRTSGGRLKRAFHRAFGLTVHPTGDEVSKLIARLRELNQRYVTR